MKNLSKITRLEVIDSTGRAYVNMNAGQVEVMLQDNDQTMKVFTNGGKERTFTESEVRAMVKEMIETGSHNEDGWLVVRKQEILGVFDRLVFPLIDTNKHQ